MSKFPVGIQLYTVREDLEKDFKGTLKALAKMGYAGVEFAWNYGGMKPDELAGFLKELGLKACGLHTSLEALLNADDENYAYAKALGSPYMTTSLLREVAKDWPATIDDVARAAAVAKEQGFVFTYHHHAEEFQLIEGKCALDLLLERTSADTVKVELDTHWIKKGGQVPAEYIRKYAGRVPQLHVKDMAADGGFIEVGQGVLDFAEIAKAAVDAGVKWLIVEQDVCKAAAIDSAKLSIENMKKLGIA